MYNCPNPSFLRLLVPEVMYQTNKWLKDQKHHNNCSEDSVSVLVELMGVSSVLLPSRIKTYYINDRSCFDAEAKTGEHHNPSQELNGDV